MRRSTRIALPTNNFFTTECASSDILRNKRRSKNDLLNSFITAWVKAQRHVLLNFEIYTTVTYNHENVLAE